MVRHAAVDPLLADSEGLCLYLVAAWKQWSTSSLIQVANLTNICQVGGGGGMGSMATISTTGPNGPGGGFIALDNAEMFSLGDGNGKIQLLNTIFHIEALSDICQIAWWELGERKWIPWWSPAVWEMSIALDGSGQFTLASKGINGMT